LATAEGQHEGGSGLGVARDDREDLALLLPLDEPAADFARAVEAAVEDDLHDGVERVGGEVLRGGEEIAGRVVDELVGRTELPFQRVEGARDRFGLADVGGRESRLPSRLADRGHRLLERLLAPAHDADLRPQAGHAQGHRASEPRAAARDDRGLAREQVLAERLEWLHDVSS
jgi:hypothetical protein